jgi:hypothetical protein
MAISNVGRSAEVESTERHGFRQRGAKAKVGGICSFFSTPGVRFYGDGLVIEGKLVKKRPGIQVPMQQLT